MFWVVSGGLKAFRPTPFLKKKNANAKVWPSYFWPFPLLRSRNLPAPEPVRVPRYSCGLTAGPAMLGNLYEVERKASGEESTRCSDLLPLACNLHDLYASCMAVAGKLHAAFKLHSTYMELHKCCMGCMQVAAWCSCKLQQIACGLLCTPCNLHTINFTCKVACNCMQTAWCVCKLHAGCMKTRLKYFARVNWMTRWVEIISASTSTEKRGKSRVLQSMPGV